MKFYLCDPEKNKECKKTTCYKENPCGTCMLTTHKKYRVTLLKRISNKIKELRAFMRW